MPVLITVDAAEPVGPLRPIYRYFGADEPNYAYLPDGRRLLGEIGRLGHRRGQPASSSPTSGRPVSCKRSTGRGRWRYATGLRRSRCGYPGRAYPC